MLLWILVALIASVTSQDEAMEEINDLDQQLQDLAKVQSEITMRTNKHHQLQLKLSRLFENSIKHNQVNLSISDVSLLPSISIPYKDNIFYSMLLKRKENIYTLRGDSVLQQPSQPVLMSSVRNQQTYFAELLINSTIKISKLKVFNKKTQLQFEKLIDSQDLHGFKPNIFIVAPFSSSKYYIFGSTFDKTIFIFERNGTLIKALKVEKTVRSIKRINNNLVVLTENELFFLNINKNLSKISCLIPFEVIQSFQHDESNLKYIYGISSSSIFQFQLNSHCRPINRFYILPNSSFTVTGQVIFLSTSQISYAINRTTGQTQLYSFPFGECLGKKKIEINRKIQSSYIVSQICLDQSQINMTHILIELQDSSTEVTDFSKFRIPLLFFSFGIIIYVTVKNKNKNKESEQGEDDKAIQENLLKQLAILEERSPNKASETQQLSQKQPPIFEKKKKH